MVSSRHINTAQVAKSMSAVTSTLSDPTIMRFFTSLWALCVQYAGYPASLWNEATVASNQYPLDISSHHHGGGQKPIGGTCNTKDNRACWSKGFDIHTDYEQKWPKGKLVEVLPMLSLAVSGVRKAHGSRNPSTLPMAGMLETAITSQRCLSMAPILGL